MYDKNRELLKKQHIESSSEDEMSEDEVEEKELVVEEDGTNPWMNTAPHLLSKEKYKMPANMTNIYKEADEMKMALDDATSEPKVHITHKEEAPEGTYMEEVFNIAEDLAETEKRVKTKERLNKKPETSATKVKKEKLKKKKEKKIVFEKNKKGDYEIAEDKKRYDSESDADELETQDAADEEITISQTRKTTMEDMEGDWSDPEQGEEEDKKKRQHTKENR